MNLLSQTTKKNISKGIWRCFWHVQRKRWWLIHLTVLLASAFVMIKTSTLPGAETNFCWFPIIFWQGVAASAFAAGLVSLFQLLATTTDNAEHSFWNTEAFKFKQSGLIEVFTERGTAQASEYYSARIKSARERIWAVGMTNGKMVKDHSHDLIEAATKYESLDIIVAFWNPDAKLICGDLNMSLSDIQAMLENDSFVSSNSHCQIASRQEALKADIIKRKQNLRGRIRIVNVSVPSNFTAFVFDDEVFFFPFLAATTSAVTPTMLAVSDAMLGEKVVNHFKKLFDESDAVSSRLVKIVFDSKAPTPVASGNPGGAGK